MTDEIKRLFKELNDIAFSDDKRLEKALQKAKANDNFRKVNYGKYRVLICGDHESQEINLEFLGNFKKELKLKGINCVIGNDYIQKAKDAREEDIRKAYLKDADIIIFINGKGPGTIDESGIIRRDNSLKRKTLAFFKYDNFEELKNIPDKQDYITEFKYPVPYKEIEELKAKVEFGVKHMILYFLNKELYKEAER